MKVNERLLIALYKRLKGDRLYAMDVLGVDAVRDSGKCVGYEIKRDHIPDLRLLFQRTHGGWPFNSGDYLQYYVDPSKHPLPASHGYWNITINESVVKELLRQRKLIKS